MGSSVKIELVSSGFAQLLKGQEVLALMASEAKKVAAKAGAGFESSAQVGRTRVVAAVFATTEEAFHAEAKSAVLTKALVGGRG